MTTLMTHSVYPGHVVLIHGGKDDEVLSLTISGPKNDAEIFLTPDQARELADDLRCAANKVAR